MSDMKNNEIHEIDLLPDVHKEVVNMYNHMNVSY